MLNKVILMGRLTKDPELRHTQTGLPVVSFSLAVDRGFKADGQSVDFINIVAWRSTAEFVSKWFTKGQLVAVSGRLQVRSYKDREGFSRSITEVVADEVFFAEKKRDGNGIGYEDTEPVTATENEYEELFGEDEDLPFEEVRKL